MNSMCKQVIATDENGNETYFPSIKEAADKMGVKRSEISLACVGRHRCRGLYWRKVERDRTQITKTQASVVLAYAHNGMKMKPTKEVLYFNVNSIRYHLDKVHEKTGKDPRNFFELYELVEIARKVLEDEN